MPAVIEKQIRTKLHHHALGVAYSVLHNPNSSWPECGGVLLSGSRPLRGPGSCERCGGNGRDRGQRRQIAGVGGGSDRGHGIVRCRRDPPSASCRLSYLRTKWPGIPTPEIGNFKRRETSK